MQIPSPPFTPVFRVITQKPGTNLAGTYPKEKGSMPLTA